MTARRRFTGYLLAVVASVGSGSGCRGDGPRTPTSSRPIEASRALRLVADSVASAGERPEMGRSIRLPSGRSLRVDVGVRGHRYGVTYVTAVDLSGLRPSDDLPPPLPDGDLPIVRGSGSDKDVIVLVLRASDYAFDERVHEGYQQTAAAAENRLRRDVRDFVIQARARKVP